MSDLAFKPNPNVCFIGTTNFRSQRVRFGIKTDDRRRHMYIIGKTGMGKSVLMENMFIQDILNGHGCCFVDPHGQTAESFLKAVPAHRINDVVYFNPADAEYPIAFNFLESVDPSIRHLVASGTVSAFKKIWIDSWGPRLEYILRNCIISLLSYPGSTILGVMQILTDKEYRRKVIDKLQDPVVKSFWLNEYEKISEKNLAETISPIQNKIGQFLSSSIIRNIVAQPQSSFNFRDIMDNKKILIVNLSKGRLGEDNSALLGAMMITKLQSAAMSRIDQPESERNDFFTYVDEFQNFATDSFATILSEARKFRLNLTVGHQYIDQLGDTVRSAVFGNVGTIIACRVGAADAEFLEKEFAPRFTKDDLINQPKWKAYMRLMIDGVASEAFSADLLPPVKVDEDSTTEEKIIRVVRERYCQPRASVEEKIQRFTAVDEESIKANRLGSMGSRVELPVGALAFEAPVFSAPKKDDHPPVIPANAGIQVPVLPIPMDPRVREDDKEPVVAKIDPVVPPAVKTEISAPAVVSAPIPKKENGVLPLPSFGALPTNLKALKRQEKAPAAAKKETAVGYPAVCARCGKDFQAPFKPDGVRPTYCQECLPLVRAEQDARKKAPPAPAVASAPAAPTISLQAAIGNRAPAPVEIEEKEYDG